MKKKRTETGKHKSIGKQADHKNHFCSKSNIDIKKYHLQKAKPKPSHGIPETKGHLFSTILENSLQTLLLQSQF